LTSLTTGHSGQAVSPALLFSCVLGLLVAGTAALWAAQPGMGRVKNITRAERPSDDHYLAHDQGGHVDHHVLYFGTDEVALEHLRRADVLILGNSRLMFAARPRVLDAFFSARGLRYYVLGFGLREGDAFPLSIIERFDLRPQTVIVNADGFFNHDQSTLADVVVRDSEFAAYRQQWEAETRHEVRRNVHLLLPNWIDLFGRPGFVWRHEMVAYRSRTNGSWQMSPWDIGHQAVAGRDGRQPPLGRREMSAASAFAWKMRERGASIILTYVPTPMPLGGGPELFAEYLGVPLVAPHPHGLRVSDGDHLDEPSAVAWSEALVQGLERVIP
jgi:hypothetical protein